LGALPPDCVVHSHAVLTRSLLTAFDFQNQKEGPIMNGYAGQILRIDLTAQQTSIIPTDQYAKDWVGGHGMGAAIFFDLLQDKLHEMKDGFHPDNVVVMMTSPLTGSLVPACAGRIELVAIGLQSYPIGWFTRSNFGGRFATMLKHAGWDGIVIEGKAEAPVWIDIRDNRVAIRRCAELSLWGADAWDCQTAIWEYVAEGQPYGKWVDVGDREERLTTQRPAVVAIGPAGEHRCRTACLIHDASNASGQGGFGAIWGDKQLKAISVIGTGGVHVHDARALLEARLWLKEKYAFRLHDVKTTHIQPQLSVGAPPVPAVLWSEEEPKRGQPFYPSRKEGQRPQACTGCHSGCRARYASGIGNEAGCVEGLFYGGANSPQIQFKATDVLNRLGLNAWEVVFTIPYLRDLHKKGALGPGKAIDCPLDFSDYGTEAFAERFLRIAAGCPDESGKTHPFTNALSQGIIRAAQQWGRLDEDLKSGDLPYAHWGLPMHFDPRTFLEWGYGTILSDRDVNEHDFTEVWGYATFADWMGEKCKLTAEEAVRIVRAKLVPYQDDPNILDYGNDNMYSPHMAKLVAWHRHSTRFWKVTALFCDWRWPDFVNLNAPDKVGCTGEAEPRFFKAVTGRDLSYADGVELGRKIWNLDHAIWTLQGRHRKDVHFADYIYMKPSESFKGLKDLLPTRQNGKWVFQDFVGRKLDRDGVEKLKTEFYNLEGWDVDTGYPKRKTLEELGLGHVADVLSRYHKLG
jgi:aldehyde:ferredoxin oxidoreductase